jgi:hypothetical protein
MSLPCPSSDRTCFPESRRLHPLLAFLQMAVRAQEERTAVRVPDTESESRAACSALVSSAARGTARPQPPSGRRRAHAGSSPVPPESASPPSPGRACRPSSRTTAARRQPATGSRTRRSPVQASSDAQATPRPRPSVASGLAPGVPRQHASARSAQESAPPAPDTNPALSSGCSRRRPLVNARQQPLAHSTLWIPTISPDPGRPQSPRAAARRIVSGCTANSSAICLVVRCRSTTATTVDPVPDPHPPGRTSPTSHARACELDRRSRPSGRRRTNG